MLKAIKPNYAVKEKKIILKGVTPDKFVEKLSKSLNFDGNGSGSVPITFRWTTKKNNFVMATIDYYEGNPKPMGKGKKYSIGAPVKEKAIEDSSLELFDYFETDAPEILVEIVEEYYN